MPCPRAGQGNQGTEHPPRRGHPGTVGNNRVGTRIVHVDRIEKYVEAEGVFHHLETKLRDHGARAPADARTAKAGCSKTI